MDDGGIILELAKGNGIAGALLGIVAFLVHKWIGGIGSKIDGFDNRIAALRESQVAEGKSIMQELAHMREDSLERYTVISERLARIERTLDLTPIEGIPVGSVTEYSRRRRDNGGRG